MNKVTLEGKVKHITGKAYLLEIDGKDHWIPKSQMELVDDFEHDDVIINDNIEFNLPEWLAMEKNLV